MSVLNAVMKAMSESLDIHSAVQQVLRDSRDSDDRDSGDSDCDNGDRDRGDSDNQGNAIVNDVRCHYQY